ncbi:MAG: lytic murein transglycosylase [Robiginitomaculum sp.]
MIKYFTLFSLVFGACAASPKPAPATLQYQAKTMRKSAEHAPEIKSASKTVSTQTERFENWKQRFIKQAISKGYAEDLVRNTIAPAIIDPKALDRNEKQAEFSRPIWSYVDGVKSTARINGGMEKISMHGQLYEGIKSRYGVNKEILTAIWGLESSYGKFLGDHDIINALSTFAFEGRRSKFGTAQLYGILDMLARGDIRREQLTGSWAGAMGMTQFIPTTFRDYAIDYNSNGNKDLWEDTGDALASTAHYLNRFGWRPEEPVLTEIVLPKGFDFGLSDGTKRTIAGWTSLGVRPISGKNWPKDALSLEAKLLVPAGSNGPVFLSFKNFDVIKKYNNSTAYAMGIHVLAESFKGNRAILKDWPRDDKPLSLTDKENLQIALTRQGFNTGGVDGKIGPNSRRAIRAWQHANGYPANAYVEQKLLKVILGK